MFCTGLWPSLSGAADWRQAEPRPRAKSAPRLAAGPARRCNWANGGYSPRRFCAQNLPSIPGRRAIHAASEEQCSLRLHLPKAACSAAILAE